MAELNGKEILFNPTMRVGGATYYDELSGVPIKNADLDNTAASAADLTVLYHHTGSSTATYKKTALYYSNGSAWCEFGVSITNAQITEII